MAGKNDIFGVLRQEILSGDLEPGTFLKEVELAKRFGVSRTPVRDALQRLEDNGLIERTSRGTEVKGIDPGLVMQVYDIRILLEEEVCGQAARSSSLADQLKMEALLERDKQSKDTDGHQRMEMNLEFHASIWEASRNPILKDFLERLIPNLVHAPRSTLSDDARWEESLVEHEALVTAIRNHDVEAARRIARTHFETARDIRMKMLREDAVKKTLES